MDFIGSLNANTPHNEYWLTGSELAVARNECFNNLHAVIIYQKLNKNGKERNFKVIIPPISNDVQLVIDSKTNSIDIDWLMKEIKLVLNNLRADSNFGPVPS